MKEKCIVVLMVLAFGIGGCETLSFGQIGNAFSKIGTTLQGECEDVPTSEIKECIAALKDKATEEDETVETVETVETLD